MSVRNEVIAFAQARGLNTDLVREWWSERAAVREYDGNVMRLVAERGALDEDVRERFGHYPLVGEAERSATLGEKVAYVKSQGQTRAHHCHWPGCERQVPPAVWGCREHWYRLPASLRQRIWATYQPGQERDMSPSESYLEAADAVQRWIREHGR